MGLYGPRGVGPSLSLIIGLLLASWAPAQSLMVRSIRSDLQATGALVSMSQATPTQLKGFKAGYQYALRTRNLLDSRQVTSYSLLLGSRQGQWVDAFSLSYAGLRAAFSPDGFGQVFGFLARTCLGATGDTVSAAAKEFGHLVYRAQESGQTQSVHRRYGPLSLSIVNLRTDGAGFGFQIVLSSSATPGTNGWMKTCVVQP